ncbi:MAG TPA: DUF362 domain-containing protein [Planctomycetota bacterium]|jgi:uncharacterized protein (DUF362 family)
MERREFLTQVTAWSAGAAMVPLFRAGTIAAEEKAAGQSTLAVAKGKDYAALVAKVLEPLGGIKAFVKPGSRVVVKPNIGWDRKPELAGNTHPDVVKAIVMLALGADAKQVLVFDRTVNDERRCYTASGIQAAVESITDKRVSCVFCDKKKYVPVDIEKAKSLKRFEFYKDALESDCDCYINVPIAKHHSIAKLTLGLKNVMGVIGGNRGEIHQQNIHQRIADLNLVVRPKLTILDATRILLRGGPSGGKPEDVKVLDTLVASSDVVAIDAYGVGLFEMKPADVPAIAAAAELGLGEADISKVKVVQA